jgi:hypothetical protein
MSDEPEKAAVYISVDAKLLETDAAVSVDIDADACGFLKADDDDEVIRKWQKCHAQSARPRPFIPRDVLSDPMIVVQWREDVAARITYFGKARNAVLTDFVVTEENPPHPDRCHVYITTNVT